MTSPRGRAADIDRNALGSDNPGAEYSGDMLRMSGARPAARIGRRRIPRQSRELIWDPEGHAAAVCGKLSVPLAMGAGRASDREAPINPTRATLSQLIRESGQKIDLPLSRTPITACSEFRTNAGWHTHHHPRSPTAAPETPRRLGGRQMCRGATAAPRSLHSTRAAAAGFVAREYGILRTAERDSSSRRLVLVRHAQIVPEYRDLGPFPAEAPVVDFKGVPATNCRAPWFA